MAKESRSTKATQNPAPHRYAHPYFDEAVTGQAGGVRVDDLQKWGLETASGPIPTTKGDGHFNLSDVIGADGAQQIVNVGEIRFHALGDSGVGHAENAEHVADEMATDFKPGAGAMNPAFLLHLGDVVYGSDKMHSYGERFYSPYKRYPGKIIAIPGNHDGETRSPVDEPSLSAFLANFCPATNAVPDQALATGIYRQPVQQPGVYWWLETPFIDIIGLYSNRNENAGTLYGLSQGNLADDSQLIWLENTLARIKALPRKGLLFASHHPPFSSGGHSGSSLMLASIDKICEKVGMWPDVHLSGHCHNMQRYTRRIAGRQICYCLAGTGGIGTQPVAPATGQPVANTTGVTYDKGLQSLGYLYVTASATKIMLEFWPLGNAHTVAFDTVSIDVN